MMEGPNEPEGYKVCVRKLQWCTKGEFEKFARSYGQIKDQALSLDGSAGFITFCSERS